MKQVIKKAEELYATARELEKSSGIKFTAITIYPYDTCEILIHSGILEAAEALGEKVTKSENRDSEYPYSCHFHYNGIKIMSIGKTEENALWRR